MSTRESGSSTQSTGTSWMRSPRRCASTSSSVSKNQPWSCDVAEQGVEHVAAHGLEAALRVGELRPQDGAQEAVVATRDELALRAAHDPRAVGEAGADREIAVAGHQRRDQRQQPAQVGREVDVHVGDDLRRARRPGGAQRAAAALLLEPQVAHARAARSRGGGRSPASRRRRVVGDDDPPAEREAVGQEAVQAANALLEAGGLVVDGNDDLDVRRRRGRERAPGSGSQKRRGELGHDHEHRPAPPEPAGTTLRAPWIRPKRHLRVRPLRFALGDWPWRRARCTASRRVLARR